MCVPFKGGVPGSVGRCEHCARVKDFVCVQVAHYDALYCRRVLCVNPSWVGNDAFPVSGVRDDVCCAWRSRIVEEFALGACHSAGGLS